MAFNSAPGRAEYTASAGQTVFAFVFKIYLDGDIKVYQTPAGQTPDDVADLLTLTTDYTVSIDGDNGGEITLVSGAGINDSIVIQRSLGIDRDIEYQTSGDLRAVTLNDDQDYQTYLIADQEANGDRQLKLPSSVSGVSSVLPAPNSLYFLQWNTNGDALRNVNSLQADGFLWTAADIYTKTETDTLLDAKADQATTYTKTESDEITDAKIDETSVAQTKVGDLTIGQSISVSSWSFVGTTITVNTAVAHNLIVGQFFTVAGLVATTNAPNGRWEVATVEDTDTITFTAVDTPTGTPTVSSATLKSGELKNIDGQVIDSSLLIEHEVTGSAVTSIDFTGLDIRTHKSYRIELDLINATGSTSNVQAYINGDTTSTNYYNQVLQASSTSVIGLRENACKIGTMYANTEMLTRYDVSLIDGYYRGLAGSSEQVAASLNFRMAAVAKVATVTNITQLTFVAAVASSIDIGSKIRIYKGDV